MSKRVHELNPRKVPRNFLTNEEKQEILKLSKMGYTSFHIAKKLNHTERQIKNFIREKQRNVESKFTREQDKAIIQQVLLGNNSWTAIAKLIGNKADWMVRNRHKLFLRRVQSLKDISEIDLFLDQFHEKVERKDSLDMIDSICIDIENLQISDAIYFDDYKIDDNSDVEDFSPPLTYDGSKVLENLIF